MSETSKGLAAMLLACVIWGLSPIFYHQLTGVSVGEVLAHRTIWSLVLFLIILGWQGRLGELARVVCGPYAGRIFLAAALISVNWGVYIWAVQIGRVVESSLGYYTFPLIMVVFGVAVLRESLPGLQGAAVGMAALAVLVLTLGLGVAPWVSLILAVTMAAYSLVKKMLPVGPVLSVGAEVVMMTPPAILWLIAEYQGWVPTGARHFGDNAAVSGLLAASGLMTAVPLILFSYASRRTRLSTLGLLQYLNPTLQFLCAVVVYNETFTHWHKIAFGLIWAALALYAAAPMLRARRSPIGK